MTIFYLLAGLALLVVGAEFLVRGSSRAAAAMGISPLIVGLTVVAFGTSAPELAVSVQSALKGNADIAVGNVVGSNIFNVLLILGISAAIVPLTVTRQLIRLDVPIMIVASGVAWLMAANGVISRWEGMLLFAGIVCYTAFLIRTARRESQAGKEEFSEEFGAKAPASAKFWVTCVVLTLGGLGMLILGSDWLVSGAVSIAKSLGVSDLVIGLTIVAGGTSAPELVTSIVAASKGERDIAVGNIVGSNIFNILCVLGISSTIVPGGIQVGASAIHFDFPIMLGVALACFPIFFTGNIVSRKEGLLFVFFYVAYTVYLVLGATGNALALTVGNAMLYGVLPLTVVGLLASLVLDLRRRKNGVIEN